MDNNTKSGGIGITTVLFLIFMTLKLTKTIDWSWWWVTSPLWIPFVLGLAVLLIVALSAYISEKL
jgi:hypothetical protein